MSLESEPLPGPGNRSSAPRSILLVDDESLFRASATRALRVRFPNTRIDAVGDGQQALEALAERDYEVVVTDLHMPNVDGFALLCELERQRYRGRVVVLTAFANDGFEVNARSHGAVHFLEKPASIEDLVLAVGEQESAVVGGFRGLSLPGLVQLIEAERLDVHLRVVASEEAQAPADLGSHPHSGSLFFEQGELVAAMAGPHVGNMAALELFSLRQGEFSYELHPLTGDRQHTIEASLGHLLLEGARLADERASDCSQELDPTEDPELIPLLVPEHDVIVAPSHGPHEDLPEGTRSLRASDQPHDYEACFRPLLEMPGVLGAAVIDTEDRRVLAHMEEPDGFDVVESARHAVWVVRAQRNALINDSADSGDDGPVPDLQEISVTLEGQLRITRVLKELDGVALHVVLDRRRVDVAAARQRILAVEQALLVI